MSQAKAPIAIVSALDLELSGALRSIPVSGSVRRDRAVFHVGSVAPAVPAGLAATEAGAPRPVVLGVLGMGRVAVEAGLATLFSEWSPAAVAFVGFAGGCAPDARPADLYVCDPQIVEPAVGPNNIPLEGRAPLEASPAVKGAILRAAGRAPVKIGRSVTVNVVAATARVKDSLFRNRDAALCDMENFWAARACADRQVPFAALRAIFDAAADPLPQAPGLGQEPLWRVLRRRPGLLLALPRLALRFRAVRRALDPVAARLAGEMAAL